MAVVHSGVGVDGLDSRPVASLGCWVWQLLHAAAEPYISETLYLNLKADTCCLVWPNNPGVYLHNVT